MNTHGIECKLTFTSVSTDPKDTAEDAKAFCEFLKNLLERSGKANMVEAKVEYKIIDHNK